MPEPRTRSPPRAWRLTVVNRPGIHGDSLRHENFVNFYKNVSIAGGLLLLAIVGPGRYALIGG